VAVEVTVDVEVEVDDGLDLLDELQAAMDRAVAPAMVITANWVSRDVRQLADINVSPIVVGPNVRVYPSKLWLSCVTGCLRRPLRRRA
jgi:hypothetical protein